MGVIDKQQSQCNDKPPGPELRHVSLCQGVECMRAAEYGQAMHHAEQQASLSRPERSQRLPGSAQ